MRRPLVLFSWFFAYNLKRINKTSALTQNKVSTHRCVPCWIADGSLTTIIRRTPLLACVIVPLASFCTIILAPSGSCKYGIYRDSGSSSGVRVDWWVTHVDGDGDGVIWWWIWWCFFVFEGVTKTTQQTETQSIKYMVWEKKKERKISKHVVKQVELMMSRAVHIWKR